VPLPSPSVPSPVPRPASTSPIGNTPAAVSPRCAAAAWTEIAFTARLSWCRRYPQRGELDDAEERVNRPLAQDRRNADPQQRRLYSAGSRPVTRATTTAATTKFQSGSTAWPPIRPLHRIPSRRIPPTRSATFCARCARSSTAGSTTPRQDHVVRACWRSGSTTRRPGAGARHPRSPG
jgi:hypothetical protein